MRLWDKFVKIFGNRFHDEIKAFSQIIFTVIVYNEDVSCVRVPFMTQHLTINVFFLPKNT